MKRSESPSPVPPHFVAFVWRYPGCTRISLPEPPSASAQGLELVTRYLRPGSTTEAHGPPRFLGNPRERALLSDPGGIVGARPLRRHDAAFRRLKHVGSRDNNHFGAQSHGPFTRCLTLRSGGCPVTTQDSLPAAGQRYRAGLITRWVPSKGFCFRILPSQAFLAHSDSAVENIVAHDNMI